MAALERRHRPAFHRFDLGDLAGGHDDDFVAGAQMSGLDAALSPENVAGPRYTEKQMATVDR